MTRDPARASHASPPCLAADIAPDYFDPLAVDPQQAVDVARWRKAQRIALLQARAALSATDRAEAATAIARRLDTLLAEIAPDLTGKVVSGYWPIKSEPDLRFWLEALTRRGVATALPVVEVVSRPLTFRPWHPQMPMVRGHWNILVPDNRESLVPDIMLAPLVGWQSGGFRLGYGGGYFDRTLAACRAKGKKPIAIGVGLASARLQTIYPQPHDIALDHIVTETGRFA
ncbi:5-formyltetrahydrofolate cyclo-ligase [Paracoccus sp. DMF-8]|uniref:5-formyltetrahydrofolate cyclo-ligase n=1 Tax=Paracoccus sp. DMF-8 TaxID=3019445 RepID=UPI0023E87FE4|nr:5-formyltetrahydrofolate cyclo-ligase [Paracoccus sp. DMF-8]MDF3604789.1 5-formyltetrahydrofolate cyclo-ligase [Paracoccus sp. DMF-8]